MSHFSVLKTKMNRKNCLVKALQALGFKPEVHDVAHELLGWGGRRRLAEIILLKQDIRHPYSDIGFALQPDGTYEAILDMAGGFNTHWLNKVTQHYNVEVDLEIAQTEGHLVEERETMKDGSIRIVLSR